MEQQLELLEFTSKKLKPHTVTDFKDVNSFALPTRFGEVENIIHPLPNNLLIRMRHYQCPTEVEFTTYSKPGFHVYVIDKSNAIEHEAHNNQQTFHSQYMHFILERDFTHYRFQACPTSGTSISLNPEALAKLEEITQVILDKQIQGFLRGEKDFTPRMQYLPLPLKVRQLVEDIRNPPVEENGLKQLYLEAKAQEWMVHILAALNQRKTGKIPQYPLRHADRLRMFEVEEYLLKHLRNPPSLNALSIMMNTNEKKLNEQFKKVFGMTIFAWHREQRLQKSMEMLEMGNQSIQQVAYYCGYKYQADFTKAFKERFKMTPSVILHTGDVAKHSL